MSSWMRLCGAIVMLSLVVACGTDAPPTRPPGRDTPPTRDTSTVGGLIAATVQIGLLGEDSSGRTVEFSGGSGTIISRDGLILTNAHVAGGDTPGLHVLYETPFRRAVTGLIIRMTEQEDRPPVDRYTARVVAIDGYLDLAVIQIDATIDGDAVDASGLDLPFVPIGDSDALSIGDGLTVVGFPGIGQDTVSVDSDEVGGFLDDPKIGPRSWIKTGAIISGGNSGGLLADAQRRIVGVPTRAQDDVGGYGQARPIKLALPLIEAATAGTSYVPPAHLVGLTGNETVTLAWGDPASETCDTGDLVRGYPSGATRLRATYSWSGLTPRLDLMFLWWRDRGGADEEWVASSSVFEWEGPASGSCGSNKYDEREGFPDGEYTVELYAGPSLERIAMATVTVGGSGQEPADRLSGRIIDSATGTGIAGAGVFVLKVGTDVDAWISDAAEEQLAARATTDAQGAYQLDRPLTVREVYPLVIYAEGYPIWRGTLRIGTSERIEDISLMRPAT